MKQIKYLLMAFIALCLTTSVNAQNNKSKKIKGSKHAHAAKYQCPMKCEGEKSYAKAGKCPVCNMDLKALVKDKAGASFQCPMKCEGDKTYAKVGKCPVCNMDLKPTALKNKTNKT
jgi:hypothetical protein